VIVTSPRWRSATLAPLSRACRQLYDWCVAHRFVARQITDFDLREHPRHGARATDRRAALTSRPGDGSRAVLEQNPELMGAGEHRVCRDLLIAVENVDRLPASLHLDPFPDEMDGHGVAVRRRTD